MDREQADISGLISFKNDTLFIKNDSGESFFLRQKEIPNLGNLIDDKDIFESFYEAYSQRAANWNENKYK